MLLYVTITCLHAALRDNFQCHEYCCTKLGQINKKQNLKFKLHHSWREEMVRGIATEKNGHGSYSGMVLQKKETWRGEAGWKTEKNKPWMQKNLGYRESHQTLEIFSFHIFLDILWIFRSISTKSLCSSISFRDPSTQSILILIILSHCFTMDF